MKTKKGFPKKTLFAKHTLLLNLTYEVFTPTVNILYTIIIYNRLLMYNKDIAIRNTTIQYAIKTKKGFPTESPFS